MNSKAKKANAATKNQLPDSVSINIKCPECGSRRLYKDGLRHLSNRSPIQRLLCRDCGYRFSESGKKFNVTHQFNGLSGSGSDLAEASMSNRDFLVKKSVDDSSFSPCKDVSSHGVTVVGKSLNALCSNDSNSQLGASKKAKKLDTAIEIETVAGESPQADAKGKIVEFAWWMKKQGYAEGTIIGRTKLLRILVKRGANLYDPESIKEAIAKQTWSNGRKENAVNAYTTFLTMTGGTWSPPIYSRIRKLPFIPTEQEIDSLISSCAPKAATLLQTLKETGARVGEIWMLRWTDLDIENRTIRITPEKGSDPRIFKITPKLLSMLQIIPKKSDYIFGSYPLHGYRTCFTRQRKKAAIKLGNPRLLQITFHTFRHWKATTEYAKTKDILHVMRLLGHKNIKNTLVYTQLIEFKEDEFVCKVAKTVQEAAALIENGFEYVCAIDDTKLFRKRK